jgi:iron(III) transport system substrate-binding protein
MRTGVDGSEAMTWANAVRPIMPTFDDGLGTHVNVTAVALAANPLHGDNAVRFLEWLVSDAGQQAMAGANFEYPIVSVAGFTDPVIEALGPLVVDPTPLPEIAANREAAARLVEAVGFNNLHPRLGGGPGFGGR